MRRVSRSGYYAWRGRVHRDSRGTYGAPRVHDELVLGHEVRCSRKRVARLMRQAGLVGVHRRRYRGCTRRDERQTRRPDLVRRDFTAPGPNRLWVADLTQHMTGEGWLYFSTVLDVFSRRVVGWAMRARAETELVLAALDMAVWNRRPQAGVIHHSDHGAQYTSVAFTKRLREAGIVGSMGTVGDALEQRRGRARRNFRTAADGRQGGLSRRRSSATSRAFYNRKRRHSALGSLSPEDYEKAARNSRRTTEPTQSEAVAS